MNKKEMKLTMDVLKILSEKVSNRSCTDVDESIFEGWTDEEKNKLGQEISEWMGDSEFDFETMLGYEHFLANFLAKKIEASYGI